MGAALIIGGALFCELAGKRASTKAGTARQRAPKAPLQFPPTSPIDPTELLESVADTPEQQQLDGLESAQLNDVNF